MLEAQYQHQMVDTLAFFFIGSLKKKSKHSASLPQCAFTHNWKVQCLFALPIISNVRWWCAEKLKIRIRQGSVLNVVKTYGFSSSIYSWSRLFFMLKNCLLEITRHFMYCLSYIVAKKNFVIFFQALRHHCAPFNRFYKVFRTCISKIVCYVRETRELYQWKFKVYRL